MDAFTKDQKMAMLVVPMLLFSILGVSYASAAGRSFTEDDELTVRRAHVQQAGGTVTHAADLLLKEAIESADYQAFVEALAHTPFHESATRSVFDTLVRMYELHTQGNHAAASTEFRNVLYGDGHISL